jgi:hypothetical protein
MAPKPHPLRQVQGPDGRMRAVRGPIDTLSEAPTSPASSERSPKPGRARTVKRQVTELDVADIFENEHNLESGSRELLSTESVGLSVATHEDTLPALLRRGIAAPTMRSDSHAASSSCVNLNGNPEDYLFSSFPSLSQDVGTSQSSYLRTPSSSCQASQSPIIISRNASPRLPVGPAATEDSLPLRLSSVSSHLVDEQRRFTKRKRTAEDDSVQYRTLRHTADNTLVPSTMPQRYNLRTRKQPSTAAQAAPGRNMSSRKQASPAKVAQRTPKVNVTMKQSSSSHSKPAKRSSSHPRAEPTTTSKRASKRRRY